MQVAAGRTSPKKKWGANATRGIVAYTWDWFWVVRGVQVQSLEGQRDQRQTCLRGRAPFS